MLPGNYIYITLVWKLGDVSLWRHMKRQTTSKWTFLKSFGTHFLHNPSFISVSKGVSLLITNQTKVWIVHQLFWWRNKEIIAKTILANHRRARLKTFLNQLQHAPNVDNEDFCFPANWLGPLEAEHKLKMCNKSLPKCLKKVHFWGTLTSDITS